MNDIDPAKTTTTKSLLYWRKSKLNGLKCVPAVVALDENGVFSLKDTDGQVAFSMPANQLHIKFTGWGTMVVEANGKKYDIVGSGAGVSPNPTPEQLKEVEPYATLDPRIQKALTKAGASGAAFSGAGAAGGVAGVAGTAAMTYGFQQGVGSIKTWQTLLENAGATVKKSRMNYMTIYLLAFAAFALLIIGMIIFR